MFEARLRIEKVYFYCRKTKQEKACRSSVVEHKNKKKKLRQHSVSEPINIENTGLKSGSDGIETEHLESKGD